MVVAKEEEKKDVETEKVMTTMMTTTMMMTSMKKRKWKILITIMDTSIRADLAADTDEEITILARLQIT